MSSGSELFPPHACPPTCTHTRETIIFDRLRSRVFLQNVQMNIEWFPSHFCDSVEDRLGCAGMQAVICLFLLILAVHYRRWLCLYASSWPWCCLTAQFGFICNSASFKAGSIRLIFCSSFLKNPHPKGCHVVKGPGTWGDGGLQSGFSES